MAKKVWTDEKLEELRDLAVDMDKLALAAHFGVTPNSIISAASHYGIRLRRPYKTSYAPLFNPRESHAPVDRFLWARAA